MATAAEFCKDKKKKKSKQRHLFQHQSLDTPAIDQDHESHTAKENTKQKCGEHHGCGRMRRILFRRTRSEDRMRNVRVNETSGTLTPPEVHSRISGRNSGAIDAIQTANELTMAQNGPDGLPRSPPPPYDPSPEQQQQQRGHERNPRSLPPSYDEAVSQHLQHSSTVSQTDTNSQINALQYCTCLDCQAKYFSLDDEEQEDDGGDAVFPMETHVLMQEVLADGMAFCSVM